VVPIGEVRAEVAAFIERVAEVGAHVRPRNDSRPIGEYPQMPPRTCYLSSRFLAECFPELAVQYGQVTFFVNDVGCQVDHAWNVTPDGRIVDSTWTPPEQARHVVYHALDGGGVDG
jgi:hypothetical protein